MATIPSTGIQPQNKFLCPEAVQQVFHKSRTGYRPGSDITPARTHRQDIFHIFQLAQSTSHLKRNRDLRGNLLNDVMIAATPLKRTIQVNDMQPLCPLFLKTGGHRSRIRGINGFLFRFALNQTNTLTFF
jgi:hypothetical protein